MGTTRFCQSCGMPLDSENVKGTEKNGLISSDYCRYCYENGAFKDSAITFGEMELNVKTQMEKMKFPESLIEKSLDVLPSLKRWKNKEPVS
jgi:predicted amidophosphoribosyltransferase